jgi:hypothetical protein
MEISNVNSKFRTISTRDFKLDKSLIFPGIVFPTISFQAIKFSDEKVS